MRKEGYHDPQTHRMWGTGRNMGIELYTAGGDIQNGPETHSPGVLLRPSFRLWLRQRHLATLWILADIVFYLVHNRRTMSIEGNIEFLRRARWKNYQEKKRWKRVGNYLEMV